MGGKILQFGYDQIITSPVNTGSCSYCLQANEVELLIGLLEYQNWTTRWVSDVGDDIDQDTIDAFVDGLRAKLMAACTEVLINRINDDGDWQVSSDGGTTWTDSPDTDPRNGTSPFAPNPAEPSDDKRCASANSVVTYFKNAVEQVGAAKDRDANIADLTAVIVGVLLILGLISGGWLFAFLGAFISLIYTNYTASEWRGLFTDDMWETLVCILYSHMDSDGFVDDYRDIRTDMVAEMPDTDGTQYLLNLVAVMANSGLNNASQANYGGDLACCVDCNVDYWSIVSYDGHDVGVEISRDSTSITVQGTSHPDFGTAYNAMIVTDSDAHCCKILDLVDSVGSTGAYYYVLCGSARWPGTANSGPHTLPGDETQEYNTIFLRSDAPFTTQIKFR